MDSPGSFVLILHFISGNSGLKAEIGHKLEVWSHCIHLPMVCFRKLAPSYTNLTAYSETFESQLAESCRKVCIKQLPKYPVSQSAFEALTSNWPTQRKITRGLWSAL